MFASWVKGGLLPCGVAHKNHTSMQGGFIWGEIACVGGKGCLENQMLSPRLLSACYARQTSHSEWLANQEQPFTLFAAWSQL